MRILVSGASGFLGKSLQREFHRSHYETVPLVRVPSDRAPFWDPEAGEIQTAGLEGFDAVVHLAGENLASGRWTARRKRLFRASRVPATRMLCEALAGLDSPPKVLLAASAVGFYGSRGDEELDESSEQGSGFLANLTADWEAACNPARGANIRVVNLRMGMVLGQGGGALPRLTPLFLAGLGGRLGHGRQWMSWISEQDLTAAVSFALENGKVKGPVNLVAPEPVRNAGLSRELAVALGRLAILPAPALILKAVFGEMAEEMLLGSQRAIPSRLLDAGFHFRHPNLRSAMEHLFESRKGNR